MSGWRRMARVNIPGQQTKSSRKRKNGEKIAIIIIKIYFHSTHTLRRMLCTYTFHLNSQPTWYAVTCLKHRSDIRVNQHCDVKIVPAFEMWCCVACMNVDACVCVYVLCAAFLFLSLSLFSVWVMFRKVGDKQNNIFCVQRQFDYCFRLCCTMFNSLALHTFK